MQVHWTRKLILAVALLTAGCIVPPPQQQTFIPPPPVTTPPQPLPAAPPAPAAQNCREYNAEVYIGGVPQPAFGWACQQPDGSWQISQEGPGQPQPQVFVVPANPSAPWGYPFWAYDPFWAPRIGISGSFVFAGGSGFRHHHAFIHDRGFRDRRFRRW